MRNVSMLLIECKQELRSKPYGARPFLGVRMATNRDRKTFGGLPPSYNFILNPFPNERFTSCPGCREKTGQRKGPLAIHIDPRIMIGLDYTNRYCTRCDLLIGHKHEIEHLLTERFREIAPEIVGNDYLIFGTIKKKAWQENKLEPKPIHEMAAHMSDFKDYRLLSMTRGGWYPEAQKPPFRIPPESKEWVKHKG